MKTLILAAILVLTASAKDLTLGELMQPKNVERLPAMPQTVTLPKLYRFYMVRKIQPKTPDQKIWQMIDTGETRANRKLNQPSRTYFICTGKNDPSYCTTFYNGAAPMLSIATRQFGVFLQHSVWLTGLLTVTNYNMPGLVLNILPENVELYAVYPVAIPRVIAEWSKFEPTSLFAGESLDKPLIFASKPEDQVGVFRILLGNYSCEFQVNLGRKTK